MALLVLFVITAAPHVALAAPPPAAPAGPVVAPPAAPPPVDGSPAPTIGAPAQTAPVAAVAVPGRPPDQQSPLIAFMLSFFTPIAGITAGVLLDPDEGVGGVLFMAAGTIGPSTGWFYSGRVLTGLATTAARVVGGALMIRVLDETADASGLSVALGATVFVTATLVDWIGAPSVVVRDNARARTAVVPVVHAGGAGLSIVGSF